MKKLARFKYYFASLTLMLVAALIGYQMSNSKPPTTQDMSSYTQDQKPDETRKTLPEVNERFEQGIFTLKKIENYESRKKAGEDLLVQLMGELRKSADNPDELSFRLVDMIQTVRTGLTTKCSNIESVSKFLEISDVQAIRMINGATPAGLNKYQKEQNEIKAYNILLCNPN